jgi:hypothetical protein
MTFGHPVRRNEMTFGHPVRRNDGFGSWCFSPLPLWLSTTPPSRGLMRLDSCTPEALNVT